MLPTATFRPYSPGPVSLVQVTRPDGPGWDPMGRTVQLRAIGAPFTRSGVWYPSGPWPPSERC